MGVPAVVILGCSGKGREHSPGSNEVLFFEAWETDSDVHGSWSMSPLTHRCPRSRPGETMFGKKKKRVEISAPSNFEHRVHTGFDQNEQKFTGLPRQWQSLIEESARRPKPLVDPACITSIRPGAPKVGAPEWPWDTPTADCAGFWGLVFAAQAEVSPQGLISTWGPREAGGAVLIQGPKPHLLRCSSPLEEFLVSNSHVMHIGESGAPPVGHQTGARHNSQSRSEPRQLGYKCCEGDLDPGACLTPLSASPHTPPWAPGEQH